jgi:hypothetical protein
LEHPSWSPPQNAGAAVADVQAALMANRQIGAQVACLNEG